MAVISTRNGSQRGDLVASILLEMLGLDDRCMTDSHEGAGAFPVAGVGCYYLGL